MSRFLKISGNYTDWNIYRKSVIICDVTELFINRALTPPNRTIDQMRQAARSCKQNLVEGISDHTVSAELCIRLIGIARGSVRELLEDYRDFLRQHNLEIWSADDPRTLSTRRYCIKNDDAKKFTEQCSLRSDETVANIMITQIRQMDAMLAGMLQKLEADFIVNGGIREAMTAARKSHRGF
jgi:four helix bundle suffix protein